MHPKKILVKIVSGHDLGGVKTAEITFTNELQRKGVYVVGIIVGEGSTSEDYAEAFDKSFVLKGIFSGYKGNFVRRVLNMVQVEVASRGAAKNAFALLSSKGLNAHSMAVSVRRANLLILAGLLAKRLGCPAVWHMLGCVRHSLGRYYYHYVLKKYKITPVGNSYYTLNTLRYNEGHVVYPGYSKERVFSKPTFELRILHGIPDEAIVFGVIARLTKDKAPDIVMEAFLKSDSFKEGAHLVFAGGPIDSSLGKSLRERAEAYGKGQIHFLGHIDNVSAFYKSINILVNGRRDAEPFGISIVEAMAWGIPAIAYNAGGPSETIKHRETGWLVAKPTVEAYYATINEAWHSQNFWPFMKAAAKVQSEKFSASRQVDRYLNILILSRGHFKTCLT